MVQEELYFWSRGAKVNGCEGSGAGVGGVVVRMVC